MTYSGFSGTFAPYSTNAISAELHSDVIQFTLTTSEINIFEVTGKLLTIVEKW